MPGIRNDCRSGLLQWPVLVTVAGVVSDRDRVRDHEMDGSGGVQENGSTRAFIASILAGSDSPRYPLITA